MNAMTLALMTSGMSSYVVTTAPVRCRVPRP